MIRPATSADREAIISIIDACLHEIGDRFFPEGEGQDLLDVTASYAEKGGAFVVLETEGKVIGTHATLPINKGDGIATFRRLYLKKEFRGQRHGKALMQWAIDWCRSNDYQRIEFWSDTRFAHAHRFFATFGFQKGETRNMDDGAVPYSEYFFQLEL